jgi:uncharacterized protein (DUF302 family)
VLGNGFRPEKTLALLELRARGAATRTTRAGSGARLRRCEVTHFMKYVVSTERSVPETVDRLTKSLADRKFGVLHVHDLKKTLNGKGVPFSPECQVMEVCNPQQAAKVLSDDIDLNMALPCRVSVYEKDDKVRIGMLSPVQMLNSLSDSPGLAEIAREVESVLEEAMQEAAR